MYNRIGILNRILNKSQINQIIRALKINQLPIIVDILGGEISLHPLHQYIIDNICKIPSVQLVNIYTNNKRKIQIDYNDKINIILSYHAQYADDEKFIKNATYYNNKFNTRISLILDPLYEHKIINFYNKIKNNFNIEFLNLFKSKLISFSNLKNQRTDLLQFNNKTYIPDEFITLNLNHFKKFNCYYNKYYITVDGTLMRYCQNLNLGNVINNPEIIKQMTLEPLICTYDTCNDPCGLQYYKCLDGVEFIP